MAKPIFQNNYYYHIYNRGVDKRNVFLNKHDYSRFICCLKEFNCPESIDSLYRLNQIRRKEVELLRFDTNRRSSTSPLIDIICYCLNPNHFHLLIQQVVDKGIEKFMQKLGTGYTKYFNYKQARSGALFQGRYKAIEIKTETRLLYISAYINGNAEIHQISRSREWPWSSYHDYFNLQKNSFSKKNIILQEFTSVNDYKKYTNEVIKNSREIKEELKKYILES